MSLEKEYLEDNHKFGRLNCIVANKGGGKTYLMLQYIKISYNFDLYDKYYVILPELENESDDQYKFIKNHSKTTIYKKFDDSILEEVKKDSEKHKTFFGLDDATNYMFSNKNSNLLVHLITTLRHGYGVSMFIITHALKNVLSPLTRGMIDHLFVGGFTNAKIIKNQLWEENFSLIMAYDQFQQEYINNVVKGEHNFLYFNRKSNYDFHVNEWHLSKAKFETKPHGKSVIVTISEDKKLIKKILDKRHIKELKEKYDPKKKEFIKGKRINFF